MAKGDIATSPTTFRTIGEILLEVFPFGTWGDGSGVAAKKLSSAELSWEVPPNYAADAFAFCAYLLNHIGAMGYFVASPADSEHPSDGVPRIGINQNTRDRCKEEAKKWRESGVPPDFVRELWDAIYAYREYPASIYLYANKRVGRTPSAPPVWWEAAFALLTIADEACEGLGHFVFDLDGKLQCGTTDYELGQDFVSKLPDALAQISRLRDETRWVTRNGKSMAAKSTMSMGIMANPAVIAVHPKGRVTSVGCSIRNLSRNLAATGPLGVVRCNWQQLPGPCKIEDEEALNILLLPVPYSLRASDFEVISPGSFEVRQRWLDDPHFQEKILDLVKRATEEADVHGIVFPELALNFKAFVKLLSPLFEATGGKLKFVISGSSTDCNDKPGNMVLTALWEGNCGSSNTNDLKRVRYFSQRKHQRWRLDAGQVANYAIGSRLSPARDWWENHEIGRRELNFFQLRGDTVFSTLICEDMARNDPCHDIIRSIAPNLVFALLMDGPQLGFRWPARYAGSLADDPGCTVLSFTSFGLVGRSNNQSPDRKSNAVGLLRDSVGGCHEIQLPEGKDGVIVTLSCERAKDKTIDDRSTRHASSWKFVSQMPVGSGLRKGLWKPTAKSKPRTKSDPK